MMMALKVEQSVIVCARCGYGYARRRGFFYGSVAADYRGAGSLPICKSCTEQLYQGYLSVSNDPALAVRALCRRLNLYWSESLFNSCQKLSEGKSLLVTYLMKLNSASYAGKCYDDTLIDEDALWMFKVEPVEEHTEAPPVVPDEAEEEPVPQSVVDFWGTGYSPQMYREMQDRYDSYMKRFPEGSELDVGGEILLRQICSLEIDINHDRAAGRSVDKSVNALNNLLGSAMLKPVQKKPDGDSGAGNTPYGVWIWKVENEEPIPDPDPELEDTDHLIWYITVWFFGHLCHMLGIKNSYCRLYEEALEARRIERPDLDGEDEDTFLAEEFGDKGGDSDE